MGAPVSAQVDRSAVTTEPSGIRGQSLLTTSDLGSLPWRVGEDSVAVLDAGAAANLGRFRRLGTLLLEELGLPRVSTYPAYARFKFGDGRLWGGALRGGFARGNVGSRKGRPRLLLWMRAFRRFFVKRNGLSQQEV